MQITVNEANMKVELSKVKPGQVIKSAIGIEYIVLEHLDDGSTRVIRKDLLAERMKFDEDSNNFSTSSLNEYLNDKFYGEEVVPGFGDDNVVIHNVNQLSSDGLDDYESCNVKVGLLTIDDYRKYRKNCLKENMDSWWWLSTPDSTPTGCGGDYVQCVIGGGCVDCGDCGRERGVRPDFVLKSSICVESMAED
ncbi:hypothetical protein [Lacrimispora amygdalina]|uniref:hypothetical protein n=1 Tax=Lacrimispora amygdalina TaxID=253257 RepID=UPI000BE30ED9|nr:hypothetical protein [Lacrimispora amygdalina]